MDLNTLLRKVSNKELDLTSAEAQIRSMGYVQVSDIAKIDSFRMHRTGIMEAILAEGKDPDDVVMIAKAQVSSAGRVLITRIGPEHKKALELGFGTHHRMGST